MKILVVDDNKDARMIQKKIFESDGHEVETAHNGKDALKKARTSIPDIIVSDIFMPVMDGFQLCREVKADKDLCNVPFIFYTATFNDSRDEKLALGLGAERFIIKPLAPEKFLGIIKDVFEECGGRQIHEPKAPMTGESVFLREYNEVLVRKLEDRKIRLRQAEEKLRKSENQLHALAARLAGVEDEERRKLATELHDQVGQNLSALSINLHMVKNQLPKETPKKILDRLNDSLNLLENSTRRIRNVMFELLIPDLSEDYGLLSALKYYGEEFNKRFGIDIQIKGKEPTQRIPIKTQIMLYHIAKEAMTNVSKHARALCITISLEESDDRIRLSLSDDGRGFTPDFTVKPHKDKGWGLLIMKERARAIGARFFIDSGPGKGTKIVVELKKTRIPCP